MLASLKHTNEYSKEYPSSFKEDHKNVHAGNTFYWQDRIHSAVNKVTGGVSKVTGGVKNVVKDFWVDLGDDKIGRFGGKDTKYY